VHPSVPARNAKELIALARLRPGAFTYASAGVGSSSHLATALLGQMAKLKLVHVPFRGGAEAVTANASGQVDMGFASVTAAVPLMNANKVRPIAVSGLKRSKMIGTVPTLNESVLPGYDRSSWFGILAPTHLPKDIVTRVNSEIVQIVDTGEVKNLLSNQGLEPRSTTPAQFAEIIRREVKQNAHLVSLTGAKAE